MTDHTARGRTYWQTLDPPTYPLFANTGHLVENQNHWNEIWGKVEHSTHCDRDQRLITPKAAETCLRSPAPLDNTWVGNKESWHKIRAWLLTVNEIRELWRRRETTAEKQEFNKPTTHMKSGESELKRGKLKTEKQSIDSNQLVSRICCYEAMTDRAREQNLTQAENYNDNYAQKRANLAVRSRTDASNQWHWLFKNHCSTRAKFE